MSRADDYILVIDSGVGGISVLRELIKVLPDERFIYVGDSANAPYGEKTAAQVYSHTKSSIAHEYAKGIKAIVIACNTITASCINELRADYPDFPVIGIEPALKPAFEKYHTSDGVKPKILILATPFTVKSEKLGKLSERFEEEADIYRRSCSDLVRFVESGLADDEACLEYLTDVVSSCGKIKFDAVVLGCTHFPFAKRAIRKAINYDFEFFDGGEGTARQTKRRLEEEGLLCEESETRKPIKERVTIINSAGRVYEELSWRLLTEE